MTSEQPASGGTELGRFLRARRARITPVEAGLATGPFPRRTPGLRREELAALAGISTDYYTRLERGRETRPSTSVVDALARALHLAEDEREHLYVLVGLAARAAPEPPAAPGRTVRPGVRLLLESLRPNPAHIVSRTDDLLAANPGGLRLLTGIAERPTRQRNLARDHPYSRHQRTGSLRHRTRLHGAQPRLRPGGRGPGRHRPGPCRRRPGRHLLRHGPDVRPLHQRGTRRPRPGTRT
ncbi:helix-turn-helix domain-containing protein [Streptomyces sp. SD11]|uniref:helix-turn-helix domain-containing protein n=1 Tax=Streptomyces sp. SD11 TaxID=3452209 RepID=UPI003F887C59